jgi:hypothetical protein
MFASMNKLTSLVLLMFLTTGAVTQVQHAPTVEQCRADYAVWKVTIGEPTNNYRTVEAQVDEMNSCVHVDTSRAANYLDFQNTGNVDSLTRMQHFLERHGLTGQFLSEDAKGLR